MKSDKVGYRFYFDKNYDFLLNEELKIHHEFHAKRYAYQRLRMYANLFIRDLRKKGFVLEKCATCSSTENLQLDHIIPIAVGGKNNVGNIQVLCQICNRKKGKRR